MRTKCLFQFDEPVSPHLATRRQGVTPPTDREFISAVAVYVQELSAEAGLLGGRNTLYIESAGGASCCCICRDRLTQNAGVHSPTLSGSSQLDVFRPLLPRIILVASHQLGGISTTISAYESLLLRGYTIDAVLVFHEEYYANHDYFHDFFEKDRGIKVGVIPLPPTMDQSVSKDTVAMRKYYQGLLSPDTRSPAPALLNVVQTLQEIHERRIRELGSMPRRALDQVWWPFVQHGAVTREEDVMVIDSAHGDFFNVYKDTSSPLSPVAVPPVETNLPTTPSPSPSLLHHMYDGSASWWTQCLGHAHPALTLAAASAAGRYGHILFPSAISAPALELTERLLKTVGKGWASRVFFSDDGSTGMEVALKMALRSVSKRWGMEKESSRALAVLGLKGSYHGDTIGVMDACEDAVYNKSVEWYRGRGFWLDSPEIRIEKGKTVIRFEAGGRGCGGVVREKQFGSLEEVYDVEKRLVEDDLAEHYRMGLEKAIRERYAESEIRFGALVLEPIVMGAGGMIFVDPLYQRVLIDLVRTNRELFPDVAPAAPLSDDTVGEPWTGLPIVFDEVFVGLRRIGPLSTTAFLKTNPDISCNAKILTGGLVPMAVTLASSSIFDAFLGPEKVEALLHGHSYTAHPIGCTVANEALRIMDRLEEGGTFDLAKQDWQVESTSADNTREKGRVWSLWSHAFVQDVSHLPLVQSVMTLGTVLVIHLHSTSTGYTSTASLSILESLRNDISIGDNSSLGTGFNIHARPLGNIIYFMASLNSPPETLRSVELALRKVLQK